MDGEAEVVPPAVWTGPEEPVADVDPAVVGVVVEGAAVAWVVGGVGLELRQRVPSDLSRGIGSAIDLDGVEVGVP